MRSESIAARCARRRLGFVPTLGALHEGHLSLVRRSRRECAFTVASIFVNPTQFAPGEDFKTYPRDLARDESVLDREGIDVLFAPATESMYPAGHKTHVQVADLSEGLCGAFRPGHFRGVATVVAKLFNIVMPDAAYFGLKDAQQAAVIRRMAADLDFGVEVVVCPTVREADGLALSSRNAFLTAEERACAPALYAALKDAAAAVAQGERSAGRVRSLVESRLEGTSFRLQYVEAVDAETLRPLDRLEGEILVAAAACLGSTRLIDNILIRIPMEPNGKHAEGRRRTAKDGS